MSLSSPPSRPLSATTGVLFDRVRLVNPLTQQIVDDNEVLAIEVGAILLRVGPEGERAAETKMHGRPS